ncbi:MAG: nitroreductase family protein [Candidatus Binataceae bacterium]
MMHELFESRHCVRAFQPGKLDRERLSAILQAANSAPSAGDLKAREFFVVEDEAIKAGLVEAAYPCGRSSNIALN